MVGKTKAERIQGAKLAIANLTAAIEDLEGEGCGEEVLAPYRRNLEAEKDRLNKLEVKAK